MVGCTSTYTVGSKVAGNDYDIVQLNMRLEKKKCTVVFSTGEERKVMDIISSKDSVTWITYDRINVARSQISSVQRFKGESETVVIFKSGQTKEVNELIIKDDSVSWMELIRFSVPLSRITKIVYVNHTQGFLDGLSTGAIVGGVTFLGIFGSSQGNSEQELIGLGTGLVIGGSIFLLSPIVYAIIGHTEEFRFQTSYHKK